MLGAVHFPASPDDVVRATDGKTLEVTPGNVIEPARFLRDAAVERFESPRAVASYLIQVGAIRAGGRDTFPSQENALPGHEGEGTSYESAFSREPPEGAMHQETAPPSGSGGTKGVRRPPA